MQYNNSINQQNFLYSVNENSAGYIINKILKKNNGNFLIITTNDRELYNIANNIKFYDKDIDINIFPAWDCLPYDRISPNNKIINERIKCLDNIASNPKNRLVISTINAVIQKIIPKNIILNSSFVIDINDKISIDNLALRLVNSGYNLVNEVTDIGEFAVRGGIIDIFPVGYDLPIRIDCFGDTIENIRKFDPFTQISNDKIDHIKILPLGEVVITQESKERFLENYVKLFKIPQLSDDQLYTSIANDRKYIGTEHWLPLFYPAISTIFDYLNNPTVLFLPHVMDNIHKNIEKINEFYQTRVEAKKLNSYAEQVYHPLPPNYLYLVNNEIKTLLDKLPTTQLVPYRKLDIIKEQQEAYHYDYKIEALPNFYNRSQEQKISALDLLKEFIDNHQNKPIIITAISNGSAERIKHILEKYEIYTDILDSYADIMKTKSSVYITILNLEHGFIADDVIFITEEDLFGQKLVSKPSQKSKNTEKLLQEANSLLPGEHVVHIEYGIGRYEGLTILEVTGAKHDCLELTYADGDKLYIPVENLEIITRYGDNAHNIKLDKLSSNSWQLRKANLKKRIKYAAEKLLNVAAERELIPASKFIAPTDSYEEFCARFPYAETDDQISAIADIEEDLKSGHLMDRLICGDVGFGKTEIALRAAFIVASNQSQEKSQVAIITPTTLLCRQHYQTFMERFRNLPYKIKQLSRMVSNKEARITHEEIRNGDVDIVIGTHALLSNNISFKNLKLLIIDEEQHFGVKQKEKLKELQSDMHILSLSATPIPRTLQMSLAGVRSLSLITTPPIDRLAVRTYVMPFDPVIIREAIMREHYRGGSSFVVCHFIRDLESVHKQLIELIPEVKIMIAHGRMKTSELENIINKFYDRQFDVLLSTTIIESGLDIPTANTMIIYNADDFGLSQLYQLRGRVGRSKTRGYAYLTYHPKQSLTKEATQRLEVMSKCDSLGAGFSIATNDMDIRGFGNILGEEQSGNIKEVGVELYQSMLNDAVAELQNSDIDFTKKDWTPQINISIPIYIPDEYIQDLQLRMGLYRRISLLKDEKDIDSFIIEMVDRFGSAPESVHNLLDIMSLKLLCKGLNIEKADVGTKGILITFKDNNFAHPEAMINFIQLNKHWTKLRNDQRLFFQKDLSNKSKQLSALKDIIDVITKIN